MESAYTPVQLSEWETHVNLPSKYHRTSNPPLDIDYLTALHIHQIAAVPYENISLHYSNHRSVSLDPHVQFQKIVGDNRGRGGYCMEGNLLFNHILRAAGFVAYTAGVRIRSRVEGVPMGREYTGWVHVVNIITLHSGAKYVSDVAFGGDGPTRPLPLVENHIQTNLGTQQVRYIQDNIPQQTIQYPKYWIYQYRNSVDKEWNNFYAFTEMEFFHNDFVGMNHYTSSFLGGTNFQVQVVLVVRFLLGVVGGEGGEDGGELGIVGKLMMVDGVVKRNDGGRTSVVKVCRSERERVEVLREMFGIGLTEEEVRAIQGFRTELVEKVKE